MHYSTLKNRQTSILKKLPNSGDYAEFSKKDVAMKDLLKLTNATGDEFNMFTKGGRRFIIRGKGSDISVSDRMYKELISGKYGKFSGHTHPPGAKLTPGPADRPFLTKMNQSRSGIWGNTQEKPFVFGRTTADDLLPSVGKDQAYYDGIDFRD